jgi:hypothetical protein
MHKMQIDIQHSRCVTSLGNDFVLLPNFFKKRFDGHGVLVHCEGVQNARSLDPRQCRILKEASRIEMFGRLFGAGELQGSCGCQAHGEQGSLFGDGASAKARRHFAPLINDED